MYTHFREEHSPPPIFEEGSAHFDERSIQFEKDGSVSRTTTIDERQPEKVELPRRLHSSLVTVWLSAFLALTLLILTGIYAGDSSLLAGYRRLGQSPSNVLLVLRVLSELGGLLLAATIAGTFEEVQWMMISRKGQKTGMSFTDYLGLQPGTGVAGLLRLAFGLKIPQISSRMWSVVRLFGIAIVPLLNVVVMSDVSTSITFDKLNYTAPARGYGVGTFNASLAAVWHPMADLLFSTNFMYFLSDARRVIDITPSAARSRCDDGESGCSLSYFIAGGIGDFATQLLASGGAGVTDAFLAEDQEGYVFDYEDGLDSWKFDLTKECASFGASIASWGLCLKNGANENEIRARIIDCPADVASAGKCQSTTSWMANRGFSTTMRMWYQPATLAYSRINDSILSYTLSSPDKKRSAPISAPELLQAFDLVFTESTRTSPFAIALAGLGVGNNTSATPIYAWWYIHGASRLADKDPAARRRGIGSLQSLLGLTIYHCQSKAFGEIIDSGYDNDTFIGKAILASFPADVPTTPFFPAALRYIIVIDPATLVAYLAMGGATLIACFAALTLVTFFSPPTKPHGASAFPMLDFITQCEVIQVGQGNKRASVISTEELQRRARKTTEGELVDDAMTMRIVLAEKKREGGSTWSLINPNTMESMGR